MVSEKIQEKKFKWHFGEQSDELHNRIWSEYGYCINIDIVLIANMSRPKILYIELFAKTGKNWKPEYRQWEYIGWNDKIVALEKTTWFHFRLMKTGFLFFVADHLLVGQLCTNPKSDRYFYHVWKWHNVQRARSEMRRCTTHALYWSKLWQQDHCQHPQNANLDCHE